MGRFLTFGLVALAASGALFGGEGAVAPLSGDRLELVLENAVPYSPRRSGKRPHRDLRLILEVTEDGKAFSAEGVAWIDAAVATEHRVTVAASRVEAAAVHLELAVTVAPQAPRLSGGTLAVNVDLVRDGRQLCGEYSLEAVATPGKELRAVRKRYGLPFGHAFTGGLRDGKTASLTFVAEGVQPIVARGRLVDLTEARRLAHPRLFGGLDVGAVREALETASGKQLRALLDERAVPEARTADALLARVLVARLDGEGDWQAFARELDAHLQRTMALRGREWADTLGALALVYDVGASDWQDDVRKTLALRLTTLATAALGHTTVMPFADDGILGWPVNARDPELAVGRATLGLVTLTGDVDAWGEGNQATLARIARGNEWRLDRFANAMLGETGAGPGTIAAREAQDAVARFYAARLLMSGRPPSHPGWRKLFRWHARAGCLTRAMGTADAGGDWCAPAALLADPVDLPGVAWWRERHPATPSSSLALAFELALLVRLPEPAVPTWRLPEADDAMGAAVFRESWDEGAFVTHVESGAPIPEGGPSCGRLGIRGRGREWVVEPRKDAADEAGRARAENVLQIRKGANRQHRPLWPARGGRLFRLRARREGDGSAGIVAPSYVDRDPKTGALETIAAKKASWSWRTVGVDHGGTAGVPYLAVVVDGTYGTRPRDRVWILHLGDVPEEQVTIEAQRFEVRPVGTEVWMRGLLLFPGKVTVRYATDEDGANARIEAWLSEPSISDEDLSAETFDRLNRAILYGRGKVRAEADDWTELDLRQPEDAERLRRWERCVMRKIQRVTTSTNMGAPTLGQRVRNHAVAVLTIGAGEHPPVAIPGPDDPDLVAVGKRKVRYHEFLVEFLEDER